MVPKKRRAESGIAKGFTLIEIVVALSLISIALLALIPLVVSANNTNNETVYRVKAQAAAAQKMDNILSASVAANVDAYGNLICSGATYTDYVDEMTGIVTSASTGASTEIQRTWVIAPSLGSNLSFPICTITVTTTYTYKYTNSSDNLNTNALWKSFTLVSEWSR